jgi:predicted NBD/HSP70 family sugar kinase
MTGTSFYSVEKVASGRSGGTTQAESRVYNERLIVSLVRRHGQLSKAELTRLTGLAAQTITTIVNRAADDGMLLRRDPLRGRLGQPSIPYSLNPEAAYSFGLKFDQRSADLVLVNFVGEVLGLERTTAEFLTPAAVMKFAKAAIPRLCRKHSFVSSARIAGLGIASPFHHLQSQEENGIHAAWVAAWQEIDIRAELDRVFDWPVYLFNDGMVAAGAELMFGSGLSRADFLYAYIGHSIGGGLVLDHHLFPGRNNLAGALGNMPLQADEKGGQTVPFLRSGSLRALSGKLDDESASRIWSSPEDWGDLGNALIEWIEELSSGLAHLSQSAVALVDVDNLVIDGAIPTPVRKEIAKATRRKLALALANRPEPFSVVEGTFGHLAKVIGGSSIPLLVQFSSDKELLFKG